MLLWWCLTYRVNRKSILVYELFIYYSEYYFCIIVSEVKFSGARSGILINVSLEKAVHLESGRATLKKRSGRERDSSFIYGY
jgi:hypothetical protein